MDAQNLTDKLKRAYHGMVDSLDHLVDKEGKSLKEALVLSKKKLSEWNELSHEEVEKISAEIQQDLISFSEGMEGVRASFRETLALDARYLEDTTLEKINKIANKTTFEIIQFNKNLKEAAEEATEELHEELHHQHQQWDSEHDMWLLDVALWQKEHQQAEVKLLAIQDAIREQAISLQEHSQTIRAHQLKDHQHETTMASVVKDKTSQIAEGQNELNQQTHEQMKHTHDIQDQLHQEIKYHHRKVMVLIDKLYEKIK
ncbi:MAG: hypothetical protein ACI88H_003354 [Cocleimonas sp.]|jgi:hypothetical protein